MRFILASGLNLHHNWEQTRAAAQEADKLGFWGLVMPDHYMWGRNYGPAQGGYSTLETWTALSFLAAETRNLHLGTLVTPIPFRPPAMLAKTVSTVDILSKGRSILGVGAGWSQVEFDGYSKWDPASVRVEKTAEGVNLITRLWTEPKVDFKGKYYEAKGAVLEPKPVQKPGPPLLFGGAGPKMFQLAGKYADIALIPAWPNLDNSKARKIILDEARRNGREAKLSLADMVMFPPHDWKYDRNVYNRKIEQAVRDGSKYFIVPFPVADYMNSLRDFAKNVIPSFHAQHTLSA
ncbi:MAG TPA: LLM class flavin-dependent oxidoreductase [Candidatus Bathyarchaeia archaeon]|nr:LLM class flavin-dependent oxidoreductase [Candidatus Bathyarchaeia archaeon]